MTRVEIAGDIAGTGGRRMQRRFFVFLAVAAATLATMAVPLTPDGVVASQAGNPRYEVTITNLTASQPFSPALFVTHTAAVNVFQVGSPASEGIRAIAEDGENSVLKSALMGAPGVHQVVASQAPVHRQGGPGASSMTITIEGTAAANRLSLATMLICTNDGFTGGNAIQLPQGPAPVVHLARSYDAGTEANDQLYTHIVDPCGGIGPIAVAPDGMNLRTATSGVITMHPGIQAGVGDLGANIQTTARYSWTDPVLLVVVRRIS